MLRLRQSWDSQLPLANVMSASQHMPPEIYSLRCPWQSSDRCSRRGLGSYGPEGGRSRCEGPTASLAVGCSTIYITGLVSLWPLSPSLCRGFRFLDLQSWICVRAHSSTRPIITDLHWHQQLRGAVCHAEWPHGANSWMFTSSSWTRVILHDLLPRVLPDSLWLQSQTTIGTRTCTRLLVSMEKFVSYCACSTQVGAPCRG